MVERQAKSSFSQQFPQTDEDEKAAEAFAQDLHIQRGGRPGGEGGARKARGDGGKEGFFLHVPVFEMGGEGGGGGGQEVEQVDPLGQGLGTPAKLVM